jgi:para-aminobenzoate synthetase component 1
MMPCNESFVLEPGRIPDLEAWLVRNGADAFLSSPGFAGETRCLCGLEPQDELVVREDTAREQLKGFAFSGPGPCLGFLSYDYGMLLRGIGTQKQSGFPLGHLRKYALLVEHDCVSGAVSVSGRDSEQVRRTARILSEPGPQRHPGFFPDLGQPVASMDRPSYEHGVRGTLERIRQGWTYQLNLSTRLGWACDCAAHDPAELFLALHASHGAPFYAHFSSGQYRILSTSPELFVRVRNGRVLSRPIKGTLAVPGERVYSVADVDPELVRALTESEKECAELSMIVDLMRNDVSANCEYGSVRVENHRSVFVVDNLLQMHADVRGTLRAGRDCLDLFLDAFPGGSVTGCPKASSMRIIDELEPHARGMFCGSLVIIEDERTMDSSIAIRTAVADTKGGTLDYWAGSGIVIDSCPAREYRETMAKAAKFFGAAAKRGSA